MQISSLDQLVGQDIGIYQVERLIGRGHANAVYLAYDSTQTSPVALTTFILPETFSFEARQRFQERFRKEAARLTTLRHPHILPIYDYGEYAGYPYLVTPYMTNGSLADVLKRRGQLHYADVLDIVPQVVAGLAYAHGKGVFHGALKPSNIVLDDQRQMLVAGFGLKQILQMRGIGQDGRPYGHLFSIGGTLLTPAEYVAPEVVQGQSADGRTDIYSLGVILFELLSGKTPFTGTDPLEVAKPHLQPPVLSLRTHCPDLPLALVAVVNQALDPNPARRFQRVDDLIEAFARVSTVLPERGTNGPVNSQEALYNLWTLPPQGPLPSRRLDSAQRNANPPKRRPISNQRSLPFERGKNRGNNRVTRRKVVALLVASGVAVAGTAVAINLSGNAFSQQVQNLAGNVSNQQAQNNAANLAKNAAMNFVNPSDGKASVLVHLADGNFVAYDRHCTHQGVYVQYDPATQLLVCPAHGATFDPAQAGAVVQGVPQAPPIKPLPKVTVHINADGTIVAG